MTDIPATPRPTPRKGTPRADGPAEPGKAKRAATREPTPDEIQAAMDATFAAMPGGKEALPKTPKTSPKPPATPRPTGGNARTLQGRLEEFFGSLSLPFVLAGDTHCAAIIAEGAPELARAWSDLAKQNAGVNRVLTRLVEGSAWGGVILSTVSIILPIGAHHGLPLPEPVAMLFGAPMSPSASGRQQERNGDRGHTAPPSGGMTPPLSSDQPPGVVTVAGGSSHAEPTF